MDSNEQKSSFPELNGKSVEVAKATIAKIYPKFTIQVLKKGTMVTMDYRSDRIRIFVDPDTGLVDGFPKIG